MTEDIGRRRELTKREKKSRDLGEVPSAIGKERKKKKKKKRQGKNAGLGSGTSCSSRQS